ncbi:50S ribosomal protein L6 [Methylohalobius crimeensis]|uniref:50S ribosomal protein L6 n=1 Tax=Methylohalobius crimeensis TaxID=244365 RepID=UPI0003B5279B|nr:50S ribosomal protein L6 [Methylohalobius crimeensis]
MSRIANKPITIPQGVEVKLQGQDLSVKGAKGNLSWRVHDSVEVQIEDQVIQLQARLNAQQAVAMAGTMRALINNMVTGVSQGFERKLLLQGVGYRAQVQGKKLNLTVGFSHPVVYEAPDGITLEAPSQTEIAVKGADKQKVGQVAAEIRAYRPPEPYKGKGIRYADEHVVRKEAKKK